MTRRFVWLVRAAAVCTYLLIVLGGVVRITGSGLGCGDHWPVCNGRFFPPLDDIKTLIEWTHRLVAAVVSILVGSLAAYTWWLRRSGAGSTAQSSASPLGYLALALLVVQVLLGAITVKLDLPPWTVILHLGTAMTLLAVLLVAATGSQPTPGLPPSPGLRPGLVPLVLGFMTVLLGALVANLGAASACLGFPLCNGQLIPAGNYLQYLHWTHRLLAYGLAAYVAVWAYRTRSRRAGAVLGLIVIQVGIAAAMVLGGLPPALQAAHLAAGTAVWAALVTGATRRP